MHNVEFSEPASAGPLKRLVVKLFSIHKELDG